LAFGDLLHKIHPLAGQGFNMTIRDIKVLVNIIQNRLNLGLPLDSSVNEQFEKIQNTKILFFLVE
jgi:2-octaprenyl-6-methoxyphenol hydroxylase